MEEADKDHGTGCSSFELLTLTALLVFEEAKVDVVVLEVGMGGRLDATNVVPDDCILVSALTAVDLDHQAFLGNTVREIAREKASIARPHKPMVLGPQSPDHSREVEEVVREVVGSVQGELIPAAVPTKRGWASTLDSHPHFPRSLVPSAFPTDGPAPFAQPATFALPGTTDTDFVNVLLPLQGEHQLGNLGTAIAIVSALLECGHPTLNFPRRITASTVSQGVQSTRWPGRLSFHTVHLPIHAPASSAPAHEYLVLADGAHNSASAKTLASFVDDMLYAITKSPEDTSPSCPAEARTITLTYLLALSHSPPKTPQQTLTPLLSLNRNLLEPHVNVVTRVGLLRFTPPQGMPWVKSEPPAEVREVVRSLLPDAEIWAPDETNELSGEEQLCNALNWVAERQLQDARKKESEGVIIIAGSLYLVADFYRMLQKHN